MKKILYIIDDINYNSGAKGVTLFQMEQLQKDYDIYLLSLAEPKEALDFLNEDHVLESSIWEITEIYAAAFKQALKNKKYSIWQKWSRIWYAVSLRCGFGDIYFECRIKKKLQQVMEPFDTVIVVSEASKLRRLVSKLKHPKKIQWIHTDYARWSQFSEWSRAVTKRDSLIYPKFDQIVVLSEQCRRGLIEKIPEVENKTVVIPNLIDGERILKLAEEPCLIEIKPENLNLVTVARIDREKRIDKVLELASQLKRTGMAFKWYIIGDGPQRLEMEKKSREIGLGAHVLFLGHLKNPYPVMARCDTLILLSKYEGTPVTIDEAMVLGIGVIAPRVGGIEEQTEGYEAKYLFERCEDMMLIEGLKKKFNTEKYDFCKSNLYRAECIKKLIDK